MSDPTMPPLPPVAEQPIAALGSRRFPDLPGCPHCSAPVQTTNFMLGPRVEHYDPDASFRDSVWRHCRLTVAALPPPLSDDNAQAGERDA